MRHATGNLRCFVTVTYFHRCVSRRINEAKAALILTSDHADFSKNFGALDKRR